MKRHKEIFDKFGYKYIGADTYQHEELKKMSCEKEITFSDVPGGIRHIGISVKDFTSDTRDSIALNPELIEAIYFELISRGWLEIPPERVLEEWLYDVYDGTDIIDEIVMEEVDIETLTGMSWEELYGEGE